MRSIKISNEIIIEKIRSSIVIKIGLLIEELDCSLWTLFKKLDNQYYTSYNFNRQFITLKDIPKFDINGLWEYQGIRFSKWKNVEQIICQLVDKSTAGLYAGEISDLLKIKVHNQLQRCRKKETLVSKRYGQNQVYFSADREISLQQLQEREKLVKILEISKQKPLTNKEIINILLIMIKHRETLPNKIVEILDAEGIKISQYKIKWVIQTYEIKKKAFL